ncbi:MAG: tRNA glutamyl-Q(34) synthetase GluQRS [Hyphomonas sp.]|nr:tRNA glutamyl-Q(34) synthetase GluQRS [Hyphomonas sp.]
MSAFRTRFAPSPTYYLHLGHAASALQVWRRASEAGGEVLLRIEDIDTTRCRPEYTTAIYEDLAWLGLSWPEPVRVQSEHFSDFRAVVEALTRRGLTYRCFRTRTELAKMSDPLRPGPHPLDEEEKLLSSGVPFARRLSLSACEDALGDAWNALSFQERTAEGLVTRMADPAREGDIVLARKDSPSAYHVAATHDDALQGITEVIRGEDLIDAPHVQTLLQALMGWSAPVYEHHPLILDETGHKLSKRQQSISLASLRADGMTANQVRSRLGFS